MEVLTIVEQLDYSRRSEASPKRYREVGSKSIRARRWYVLPAKRSNSGDACTVDKV